MSTFDGVVAEFPDIRIDRFRPDPNRPALAHFLSHVHSDHLVGLESCNQVPLYCSPATRELLLRLERYPNRMNFAKGILESRKQTYKHLRNLLRPIPLQTPTEIELTPGNTIRVTLFDANHCVGAVMFLVEGGGRAILYTGDIRSEHWWVTSLCREPLLLPYVCHGKSGSLRRLDSIYLDTTFASKHDRYRQFPSKAEGLRELLQQVERYPPDTLFYFDAWTFGYEEVWQALSAFLTSQIHVDDYKYGIYRALHSGAEPKAPDAYKLIGSKCGNHEQAGCLTDHKSRIHSCEKGTGCEIWDKDFVRITPVISRHQGVEMAELGAGGGHGDLHQQHEIDLSEGLVNLVALCVQKLSNQPELLGSLLKMLDNASNGMRQTIPFELSDISIEASTHSDSQDHPGAADLDELPIHRLVSMLAKRVTKTKQDIPQGEVKHANHAHVRPDGLPTRITFPYSRHSSYGELYMLIEAFKPKNIHPCTVDEAGWNLEQSMGHLFGGIYDTPHVFSHDQMMLRKRNIGSEDQESPQSPCGEHDWRHQESQHSQGRFTPLRDSQHVRLNPVIHAMQPCSGKRDGELVDVEESKRRRRSSRGDFWPPQELVDQYPPVVEPREVFVANLTHDVTQRDLHHFFRKFDIAEIRIRVRDSKDPHAFASFFSASEAQRAIDVLQGQHLHGYAVRLEIARSFKRSSQHVPSSPPSIYTKWKEPTLVATNDRLSAEDHRSLWEQRIALAKQRQPAVNIKSGPARASYASRATKSRANLPNPDYGRLSPPPLSHWEEYVELSGDELKEALQREAYDAVLGSGEGWCLVSVDGHQKREEEL